MQCSQCNAEIQPEARFCMMCGEPLPQPKPNGLQIGDVGMIGELHIGAEAKTGRTNNGDYCPICGIWVKTEESFRCKECGRAHLHVEHRHPQLGVCNECVPPEQHQPEKPSRPKPASPVTKQGELLIVELSPGVDMEFVRVPAGVFTMGEDSEQHQVHLDEYWIGKTSVTNRQYQVFVEAAAHRAPSHWGDGKIPSTKADHPVVNVSWHDSRAYCDWLAALTGEIMRLPTEAEWEKAARGTAGRTYPWGDQEPDVGLCNFDSNIGDTTRVGRYSPAGDSPYGCVDMAGNVWDWTSSLYKDYPYRTGDGREDSASKENRILRGGSWGFNGRSLRSAYRYWYSPDVTYVNDGFRCARSP